MPGVYETVALGFNYRMSEIHAAIGIEQMKKLPSFLEKRRKNFDVLEAALAGTKRIRVIPQPVNERITSCHYCLSVVLDDELASKRPEIMEALTNKGIGSSVYYPQPVPRMKYYQDKYGYDASKYRNAARISDNSIALPVGPHLTEEDMKTIANALTEIINQY